MVGLQKCSSQFVRFHAIHFHIRFRSLNPVIYACSLTHTNNRHTWSRVAGTSQYTAWWCLHTHSISSSLRLPDPAKLWAAPRMSIMISIGAASHRCSCMGVSCSQLADTPCNHFQHDRTHKLGCYNKTLEFVAGRRRVDGGLRSSSCRALRSLNRYSRASIERDGSAITLLG
jgi:hypothetical protein